MGRGLGEMISGGVCFYIFLGLFCFRVSCSGEVGWFVLVLCLVMIWVLGLDRIVGWGVVVLMDKVIVLF